MESTVVRIKNKRAWERKKREENCKKHFPFLRLTSDPLSSLTEELSHYTKGTELLPDNPRICTVTAWSQTRKTQRKTLLFWLLMSYPWKSDWILNVKCISSNRYAHLVKNPSPRLSSDLNSRCIDHVFRGWASAQLRYVASESPQY